jgi:hypothetical protein
MEEHAPPDAAMCTKCAKPLFVPVILQCNHSRVCSACVRANKREECGVCGLTCKLRLRRVNLTLNGALRILRPELYTDEPLAPDPTIKDQARGLLSCRVCGLLPVQPVMLNCGHSPMCFCCYNRSKPRACPTCACLVRGDKVRVNETLDLVLRQSVPEDYVGRDAVNPETYELDTRVAELRVAVSEHPRLSKTYLDRAEHLLHKEYAQTGSGRTNLVRDCACGLVCVPKKTRKGRYFYSCPLWTPGSIKRKASDMEDPIDPHAQYHCDQFAWLSKKQVKACDLE